MAIEQPTKAEWEEIERKLDCLLTPVYLDCDGYIVRIELSRIAKMKLGITVYVNGRLKGSWLGLGGGEVPDEGKRFFQTRTRSLYTGKHKRQIRRALGKESAERKIESKNPFWQSARSLRRHLVKHNDRIVWITTYEAVGRLAQMRAN